MNAPGDNPEHDSASNAKIIADLAAALEPIIAAQLARDAAAAAFRAAQSLPSAELERLIGQDTDFGHPLMLILLKETLESHPSGEGFLAASQEALKTLRLIETSGTEFCIVQILDPYGYQAWYGTCTGAAIGVIVPTGSGEHQTAPKRSITFPCQISAYARTQAKGWEAVPPETICRTIDQKMTTGIMSRIAGFSSIACGWAVAFGGKQIAAMTDNSSTWDVVPLVRDLVEFGRAADSP